MRIRNWFLLIFSTGLGFSVTAEDDRSRLWEGSSKTVIFQHLGTMTNTVGYLHLVVQLDKAGLAIQTRRLITHLDKFSLMEDTLPSQELREQESLALSRLRLRQGAVMRQATARSLKETCLGYLKKIHGFQEDPHAPRRQRRQLLEAAQFIFSAVNGIMSQYRISKISDQVRHIQQGQEVIIARIDDVYTRLGQFSTAIRQLGRTVVQLAEAVGDISSGLMRANTLQALQQATASIGQLVAEAEAIITSLAAGKVGAHLIVAEQLPTVFEKITDIADRNGYRVSINDSREIMALDASFAFTRAGLQAIIHVPIVARYRQMDVYRFRPMPFRAGERTFINIDSVYDIIAINEDNKEFLPMKHADLAACRLTNSHWSCDDNNVVRTFDEVDHEDQDPVLCLYNLFRQRYDRIQTTCATSISGPTDKVLPMGPNKFLIMTREPKTGTKRCPGKRDRVVSIHFVGEHEVPPGCELNIGTHRIMGQIELPVEPLTRAFAWPGDPNLLVGDVDFTETDSVIDDLQQIQVDPVPVKEFREWAANHKALIQLGPGATGWTVCAAIFFGIAGIGASVYLYIIVRRLRTAFLNGYLHQLQPVAPPSPQLQLRHQHPRTTVKIVP